MSKPKKVALAYSGGLDTSVIIPWLKENYGCEVVAVCGDIGQGGDELTGLEEKARKTGASEVYVEDLREEFVSQYLWKLVRSGGVYEHKYLLGTSIARPLLAKKQVEVALAHGCDALAHGCTGKGNDQVRFEAGIAALAPDIKVLAPVRDSGMTRDKAIAFAADKGLPIDVTSKSPYSIDQNLWGRAVETGHLENIWNGPWEDVYEYTADPALPREPDELVISFTNGVPTAVDGTQKTPLEIITELNQRAGAQGVGRLDLVEDRLVGIKSREVYEAPGAIALITAHQEMENVCVERDLARFKRQAEQRWAELVYDGLWFSPLKRALDAFITQASEHVTGDIRLRLHGGRAVVTGRRSPTSLYDYKLATYDTGDTFDQALSKGFVELWGLPSKIAAIRDRRVS